MMSTVDPSAVTEHLLRTARWDASRSSGPGGQHRDKASTRAELTVSIDDLYGLPPSVFAVLVRGLRLDEGSLRLLVQEERSLARNQEIAVDRLRRLVTEALSPPAPRRPTRPTRASRERRLTNKLRRGADKDLRKPPEPD
jgi:ribosome-associated protein